MTIWYVHRNAQGAICGAIEGNPDGSSPMPEDYTEGLDDGGNAEIQAYRAMVTAVPAAPTAAEKLQAVGLSVADLKALLAT